MRDGNYQSIGLAIKSISNLLDRRIHADIGLPSGCATPMQGRVIKYLCEHRDGDLFQRDVEQYFSIRRSTATGILSLMERDGLLKRESVECDARLKKLVLTEAALEHHRRFSRYIAETEALMSQGLTDQELSAFFAVTERIRHNLEASSASPKHISTKEGTPC